MSTEAIMFSYSWYIAKHASEIISWDPLEKKQKQYTTDHMVFTLPVII